ncbi:MAG: hypothetical protein WAK62_15200, partial [Terriglobales bacterium]
MPEDQGKDQAEGARAPKRKSSTIAEITENFIQHIDSLLNSLPLAMTAIQSAHKGAHASYEEFVKNHCEEHQDADGTTHVTVQLEHHDRFKKLRKRVDQTAIAFSDVPRSFLVSLVSQYDAFLGKLVRTAFKLKPELLKSSEKTLTFSQLSEFSSLEDATEHLLEKEVETLLRKSHADQFEWLENRVGIKLRVDLPVWPTFIEVTERRNLFVHCDGVVSSQYMGTCREHRVPGDAIAELGARLEVPYKYFRAAHEAIFEIGVKLAQVLWRRLRLESLEAADSALNNITYDLLERRRYHLAKVLLDFVFTPAVKYSDEQYRLIFLVNRSQAYKWSGDNKRAHELVLAQDWTATREAFKLAAAVLTDRNQDAIDLMRKIGVGGYPHKVHYRTWPLFMEIRKTPEFALVFEEIFGECFGMPEPIPKLMQTPP